MARVVLAAFGSLGSLHPYLAIAAELRQRGQDVTVVASSAHRERVQGEGHRFEAVVPDATAKPDETPTASERRSESALKRLARSTEQSYESLLEICRTADLFVSHPAAFAGPLVAETLKLPWLSVALTPAMLFSVLDPPVLPFTPWLARYPVGGRRLRAMVFQSSRRLTRRWLKPLDELRRRVGLPPSSKHPLFEGLFSPFGTLALFSSLLADCQPDWPPNCHVTGFPLPAGRSAGVRLSPELTAFLNSGDPPIVFTLGSNALREARVFYARSAAAARLLGCRAVLLTGSDPRNRPGIGHLPSIFVADYEPHSALFPRASAVVHQGGISTMSEGLWAGVPMLIVPYIHDQPDNAFRAARLGVARVELPSRYQARRAAAHLRVLLERPAYAERAHWAKAHVQCEDGVKCACDQIAALLRGGRTAVA
jgi:rhamnosyltransferase subunit B